MHAFTFPYLFLGDAAEGGGGGWGSSTSSSSWWCAACGWGWGGWVGGEVYKESIFFSQPSQAIHACTLGEGVFSIGRWACVPRGLPGAGGAIGLGGRGGVRHGLLLSSVGGWVGWGWGKGGEGPAGAASRA